MASLSHSEPCRCLPEASGPRPLHILTFSPAESAFVFSIKKPAAAADGHFLIRSISYMQKYLKNELTV